MTNKGCNGVFKEESLEFKNTSFCAFMWLVKAVTSCCLKNPHAAGVLKMVMQEMKPRKRKGKSDLTSHIILYIIYSIPINKKAQAYFQG